MSSVNTPSVSVAASVDLHTSARSSDFEDIKPGLLGEVGEEVWVL